jgi:riboflavin biosynthesis pyrimidine reductase
MINAFRGVGVVEWGVLSDEELVAAYRTDVPVVRMNFVSSVDGAVEIDGRSGGIGGPADKATFPILRMLADGILVGAGTVRDEHYKGVRPAEPRRAWRIAQGLPEYPRLVIVSGRLDIDPAHPALAGAPVRPVVITHASSDDEKRDALAAVADVRVHGVDRVDLIAAIRDLRETYSMAHILCEGGPHLFGSLHTAGLVDEVCLSFAPLLAGPGAGRIIAGSEGPVRRLRLIHALTVDDELLLRYGVNR